MKGFSEYSLSVLSLLYSDQADAVYTHTQQVIRFDNTYLAILQPSYTYLDPDSKMDHWQYGCKIIGSWKIIEDV